VNPKYVTNVRVSAAIEVYLEGYRVECPAYSEDPLFALMGTVFASVRIMKDIDVEFFRYRVTEHLARVQK
jgi:hypothetical protein